MCRNVVRFDPISNKVIDKLCCRILVSFNNISVTLPSAPFPELEWESNTSICISRTLFLRLSPHFRLCCSVYNCECVCVIVEFSSNWIASHNKLTPNRYLCNRHRTREGSSMILIKQFKWVSIRECVLFLVLLRLLSLKWFVSCHFNDLVYFLVSIRNIVVFE